MASIRHNLNVASSVLASTFSLWYGTDAAHRKSKPQPEKSITLYDIENCPYCRVVRAALCELDLNVEIRPCPKGGTVWRKEAEAIGGKQQFPLLVDANTDTVMYESADIVKYLFTNYLGKVPGKWSPAAVAVLTGGSVLASATRLGTGLKRRANKQPAAPLTLYSFETSPFGRPVRDRLCELEIPYTLINLGKEQLLDYGPADRSWLLGKEYKTRTGGKREAMQAEYGHIASPYLVDPNTDLAMAESEDIKAYLQKTYGA